MENGTFTYQYSVKSNREVEKIRSKYLPKQTSKLDTLKMLDRRAEAAGQLQSLSLGIISSLVFGVGMCIGLKALPGEMWLALLLGVIGTVGMLAAFPIFKRISKRVKAEIAPKIIALSSELIDEK